MPASKRFEPFPKTRFTPPQLKELFTNGKLAQQFFNEDPDGYRSARAEAQALGLLGENINHHTPAPRTPAAATPAQEPALSLAECHELQKQNVTTLSKESPLMYHLMVQSLAQHGRGIARPLSIEMQARVDALANQIRAEKSAKEKSAKLTDLAMKQAALDREKQALVTPKEVKKDDKPEVSFDWDAELKASAERQKNFDDLISDAERRLAHVKLDAQLHEEASYAPPVADAEKQR